MDIPSPAAGIVTALQVKAGDRVSTGSVIATLESAEPPQPAGAGREPARGRSHGPAAQVSTVCAACRSPRPLREPSSCRTSAISPSVEIIDVLVKAGDEVAAEQGLVTLETEKATMDVPSPEAGRVLELKVAVGGKVSAGDALVVLQPSSAVEPAAAGGPQSAAPAPRFTPPPRDRREAPAGTSRSVARGAVSPTPTSFGEAHASPSVRRLARELGVELGRVRGSGAKGRVTADDVKAFVKEIMQGGAARAGRAARGAERRLREVRRVSKPSRCRASRKSRAPGCTRAGSTSRTLRSTTKPTSRSSRRSASRSRSKRSRRASSSRRSRSSCARVRGARRDAALQVVARALTAGASSSSTTRISASRPIRRMASSCP